MSISTKIQWCDSTCNPTMGCEGCELWSTKVKKCYAGRMHARFSGSTTGYAPTFEQVTQFPGRMRIASKWSDLQGKRREDKPWLDRLPRLVFVSDMSDALSKDVTFEYLKEEIIDVATSDAGLRHCWLWLTKRPDRMAKLSSWLSEEGIRWPDNIWAGTSITSQKTVARISHLSRVGTPRTIRFLSVEPQHESIDLVGSLKSVSWVIQGGESGGGAVSFNLGWARAVRDQCANAGVPYFLKQLGAAVHDDSGTLKFSDTHGGDWSEWPADLRIRPTSGGGDCKLRSRSPVDILHSTHWVVGAAVNSNFFKAKRPWSRYKDRLLEEYLPSYLEKVKRIPKPIAIVDAFAGRGKFDDGELGSPLIIANAIRNARSDVKASAFFVEADPENYAILSELIADRSAYCRATCGTFDSQLAEIERLARTATLFLYLDPYSVMGLPFERVSTIYRHISASNSVEVLLNFNAPIFTRCCLAALKRLQDAPADSEFEAGEEELRCSPERATLNAIADGDYWEAICLDPEKNFVQKVAAILRAYTLRMRRYFKFVCTFDVQERLKHAVPKYTMIYATRSDKGVILMNDIMRETRQSFVVSEVPSGRLFDLTPEEEIVTPEQLDEAILAAMKQLPARSCRPAVRFRVICNGMFGRQTKSEINKGIGRLLKNGQMTSESKNWIINDTVPLSLARR